MKQEIDLLEIAGRIWQHRRIVAITVAVAMVVGVVVALVTPTVYTARCVMVAQTGEQRGGGALGGLAAMAGVSLGGGQTGGVLSPVIYPRIMASVPFQKELMSTQVNFAENNGAPISLIDHYTKDLDLPAGVSYPHLETLSPAQAACMSVLQEQVALAVDDSSGELTLTAKMPEPLPAAQLAQASQQLLQKYITSFKIQKVQATLDFIDARTEEAREDFERSQNALASFRDRNRNIVTQTAQVRGQRLQNEYDLAFGIYSELSRQREQTRIELKETTPVFTIIEPVTIPTQRSAPNRKMIVAIFTLIGVIVGCILALAIHALAKYRAKN